MGGWVRKSVPDAKPHGSGSKKKKKKFGSKTGPGGFRTRVRAPTTVFFRLWAKKKILSQIAEWS
jgi:hypothetical protein